MGFGMDVTNVVTVFKKELAEVGKNLKKEFMRNKIVLIGAGNLGYHLGKRLYECKAGLYQIFSRTAKSAEALSLETGNTPFVTDLNEIEKNADLYIIAIKDDAIPEVAEKLHELGKKGNLIVHTSGVTPTNVFQPWFKRYGSFYPFQSFSKDQLPDFSRIPLCYFATKESDKAFLNKLGKKLGCKSYEINDLERAVLHVNGVFVNNFTNHLYQISWEIMKRENLSFDLLRPLILETALKVMENAPAEMQTGPAIRNDQQSIQRHIEYLKKFPEYKNVYEVLSKGIEGTRS
ncbi:MAG: DUF2520 domain-containing protein [Bacteroidetes bacterium]|nr:MAG: DUF2520 domain-containing protein [Bacteroidota bacterium]